MGNSGSQPRSVRATGQQMVAASGMCLHTPRGARKYLNRAERQRLVALMLQHGSEADLFGLTLAWTGARISEVLALTGEAFDLDAGLVTLRTLKRRRSSMRQVPIPGQLLMLLEARYQLSSTGSRARLWSFSRTTAWRHVKRRMREAGLAGLAACPRGFRHGFGVGTLQSGVPVTLLQRWLGHARLSTTAIYAEVSGPEERAFADGYWRWSQKSDLLPPRAH